VNEGPDIPDANGVNQYFANSQAVSWYADPGSTLEFFAFTPDTTGRTSCIFQFTGYLISYP
jgi:hypothetical protein